MASLPKSRLNAFASDVTPKVIRAAGILLFSSVFAFSQQTPSLTIQGTVSNAASNQPLAAAQVTLTTGPAQGSLPVAPATILTDDRGTFLFRNLDAGSYRLTVIKNGYVREDSSVTLVRESANTLVVRMTQTATISGSLRDASGRPVANVPVEVLRRAYNQKGLNPQSSFSAETNDLGEYRIYGITPGRYSIAAGIPDSGTSSRFLEAYSFDDQVRNGQNAVHVDYAYIYYPGVTELKKASWIDIQPGSHHSDIDFTLTRQRIFNVHGKVTMSTTGRPPDHLNWSGASGGYDAMTGRFDLKGLLPGNYAFGLSWQSLHAFVTFVVTNSDVDLPAVTLMQPATLSGRIQVEGTLPPNFPFSRLYVRLQRSEMGDYEVSSTDVRADGTFDLGDIPVGSEYRVMIPALPSGFYLKTARLGGADALQNYVPITRSANLDIVISSSSGQIRGSVINNQLQPLAAAQVVLIPDKRDRTELFKPEFTDKNGRFTIAGVPPGDYKLFAWEDLARFAFFDPEILAQFEERGKAIHVEESSEQNIELKALPAGGAP